MITRHIWYLRETLGKVWVRVVGYALLAVLAAALARVLSPYLPQALVLRTGSEAVSQLLGVLTSSMLAVTTFSLSIAVSAFTAAANTATPRATVLLQEDRTTQNVLATFLGAFLFGLVGLVALHADYYDASGQVVVFLFTIVVIALVVAALIRWISHLMQFGRMDDTLQRVEDASAQALEHRLESPHLGGVPLLRDPGDSALTIAAHETGYIRHIDMQALQKCAQAIGADVVLLRLPGSFVVAGMPLLAIDAHELDDTRRAALRTACTIGAGRSFAEDPRFGLIVLTEIASRALSPAVNDPGTAIDIIGRHTRILSRWRCVQSTEVRFDRVHVPALSVMDVIEDAFRPIARDGAGLLEVQIRLQKALSALADRAPDIFAEPCRAMSREALGRARAGHLVADEIAALHGVALATRKG